MATNGTTSAAGDWSATLGKNFKAVVARIETAREQAKSFTARSGEWIKAHPVAAISAAFGIGYVLVRLARR